MTEWFDVAKEILGDDKPRCELCGQKIYTSDQFYIKNKRCPQCWFAEQYEKGKGKNNGV